MTTALCQLICWSHLAVSVADVLADCTYMSVGDNLKLGCVLNGQLLESYNAHDISFSVLRSHQISLDAQKPAGPSCLPTASVEVVNTTAAVLTLPNVTSEDTGQYSCSVGGSNCQARHNHGKAGIIVYSENISVEEKPQNVTNLECVVHNWDESMVCQWQHPINYSNQDAMNVTSYYAIKHSRNMYKCPGQSYNGCLWSLGEFKATPQYVLNVSVTNTRTARAATAIFVIDTYRIVKPAPVEQLAAVEDRTKTGCINVSWTHARTLRPKVYRIRHQLVGDAQFSNLSWDTNDAHVVSCGHPPHTHHRFSVECLPASIWSGHWSDPVFTDAWTSMTAPGLGPRTTNGSFTTTECEAGVRNVTVMWQEVEIYQQNGVIDGYVIRQGETILQHVSEQSFWAEIQLPCHSMTELSVSAHNMGGYSIQPSVVIIPPVTFTVPREICDSFAVKIMSNQTANHTEYLVATWDESVASENTTYTIFWCMSQSSQTCQDAINWTLIPGRQGEVELPLPASLSTKYQFGISISDPHLGWTSSIHWTQCLFVDNPPHLPPVDNLKAESWEGMVLVSWEPQVCTYQSRVKVTDYIVKWRLQSHHEEEGNNRVPATQSSYTLTTLTANVPYLLTVQSERLGTAGEEVTPWIPVIMRPPTAPGVLIWVFVVIAVFVGFLAVACMLRVYRALMRRGEAFEGLGHKKMTYFLNSLPTSLTPDVVSTNRLMRGPFHDGVHIISTMPRGQVIRTPVPTRVESTSERSINPPTSPVMASAGTHHDNSGSDDSFDGGTVNSRTFLITGPGRQKREMNVLTPSTSSAGVYNEAVKSSSMTYVRSTQDVHRRTLHTELALADTIMDRECNNRDSSCACPDFQTCPNEPGSMSRSSMSFGDYSKLMRNSSAQNVSSTKQERRCTSQESIPSDARLLIHAQIAPIQSDFICTRNSQMGNTSTHEQTLASQILPVLKTPTDPGHLSCLKHITRDDNNLDKCNVEQEYRLSRVDRKRRSRRRDDPVSVRDNDVHIVMPQSPSVVGNCLHTGSDSMDILSGTYMASCGVSEILGGFTAFPSTISDNSDGLVDRPVTVSMSQGDSPQLQAFTSDQSASNPLPHLSCLPQSSHDLHTDGAFSPGQPQSSHDLHTDGAFSPGQPQSSHDLHTDGAFSPGQPQSSHDLHTDAAFSPGQPQSSHDLHTDAAFSPGQPRSRPDLHTDGAFSPGQPQSSHDLHTDGAFSPGQPQSSHDLHTDGAFSPGQPQSSHDLHTDGAFSPGQPQSSHDLHTDGAFSPGQPQSSHDLHTDGAFSPGQPQSSHDLHTDGAFSPGQPQSSHDLHTDGAFSPGRRDDSPHRSSESVTSQAEQYVRMDDFVKLSEHS